MTPLIKELKEMIDSQAEDEGLWFIADSIVEAYIQQELRKLHDLCEKVIEIESELERNVKATASEAIAVLGSVPIKTKIAVYVEIEHRANELESVINNKEIEWKTPLIHFQKRGELEGLHYCLNLLRAEET